MDIHSAPVFVWIALDRFRLTGVEMAFVEIPGFKGKVYVPEEIAGSHKKHPCKDCYSCQMCSDDRCNLCLKQKTCCRKKTVIIARRMVVFI
jgi:hypothetical protein